MCLPVGRHMSYWRVGRAVRESSIVQFPASDFVSYTFNWMVSVVLGDEIVGNFLCRRVWLSVMILVLPCAPVSVE